LLLSITSQSHLHGHRSENREAPSQPFGMSRKCKCPLSHLKFGTYPCCRAVSKILANSRIIFFSSAANSSHTPLVRLSGAVGHVDVVGGSGGVGYGDVMTATRVEW
jgi:hypothetical protein